VRTELINKIKAKQAEGSSIEWTAVITGMFIDWGLRTGFLDVDVEKRTIELWDDGNVPFTVTSLSVVARTVAKLLTDPAAYEASRNTYIYTGSVTTTQAELLAAAEKATNAKFEIERIDGQKLVSESTTKLGAGDATAAIALVKSIALARYDGEALTDLRKYGLLFNEKFGIEDKYGSTEEIVANVVKNWNELPYSRYVLPTV